MCRRLGRRIIANFNDDDGIPRPHFGTVTSVGVGRNVFGITYEDGDHEDFVSRLPALLIVRGCLTVCVVLCAAAGQLKACLDNTHSFCAFRTGYETRNAFSLASVKWPSSECPSSSALASRLLNSRRVAVLRIVPIAQCPDLARLTLPANLFRYPIWKLLSSCSSWLQIPPTRNLWSGGGMLTYVT